MKMRHRLSFWHLGETTKYGVSTCPSKDIHPNTDKRIAECLLHRIQLISEAAPTNSNTTLFTQHLNTVISKMSLLPVL